MEPNVANDALEIAWVALEEHPGTETDAGLAALRDVLRAAIRHSGASGETAVTVVEFYDRVATLVCETDLSWHCSSSSDFEAAFIRRARKGDARAQEILQTIGAAKEVKAESPK